MFGMLLQVSKLVTGSNQYYLYTLQYAVTSQYDDSYFA
jgi:hypothetical protein